MPFVPAANVIQAELIYSWDGQIVENVLHYQTVGAPSATDMSELGGFLVNWWQDNMDTNVAGSVSLDEVRMTDLTSEFAPGSSYTIGLPASGAAVSASLPNNVTLSITKRTALRGRSYRGRIYQVGLTENAVVDNEVSESIQAAILAAWNLAIEFALTSGTAPMVVVSRIQGGVERVTAEVTPVVSFSTDGIVDSQRRRLPGRGS